MQVLRFSFIMHDYEEIIVLCKAIYTSLARIPLIWEFHDNNNNIMLKLLIFIFMEVTENVLYNVYSESHAESYWVWE